MTAGNPPLGRYDYKTFMIIGSISFIIGISMLLITRLAGVGLTAMGLFLLAVGAYDYMKRGSR